MKSRWLWIWTPITIVRCFFTWWRWELAGSGRWLRVHLECVSSWSFGGLIGCWKSSGCSESTVQSLKSECSLEDSKGIASSAAASFGLIGRPPVSCYHDYAALICWSKNCYTGSSSRSKFGLALFYRIGTLVCCASSMKLYAFCILDGVYHILHNLVRFVDAVELAKGLHFVYENVVINLLLGWVFVLELIHLFKLLVFFSI